MNDVVVSNDLCCLAYDDASTDPLDVELYFACLELESRNVTTIYADGVCTQTTEVAMYVDLNADSMYNYFDDGDLFDVSAPLIDNNIDLCCADAAENGNLDVMNNACETSIVLEDEFYTYDDTLTCTKRFDRTTDYFLQADT